jgi:hypothetical protein
MLTGMLDVSAEAAERVATGASDDPQGCGKHPKNGMFVCFHRCDLSFGNTQGASVTD